uniref:Gluconeogenesis factor n=1 Tax=Globisporangium ultimum (strain ATCC 200006 / CBS 805.95 / DAOM BR144) TaxID=431595 RepID=K3WGR2_GLOUD
MPPLSHHSRPPTPPIHRTSSGSDCSASTPEKPLKRGPRCRLPSGERVNDDPRRIDAVVMILDDVLYDHTGMLAHFAVDRGIHQLMKERAFPSIAAAFEALHTFRNAYGYRKRFPRFVDSLMTQNKLTPEGAARVVSAYYESQIPEARLIEPFERARETLTTLVDAGYKLGLVLVGKQEVQLERLRTIGLQEFFPDIVFVDCNPTVPQLVKAMKEIGRRLMLQPSSILFVGRKVFYEIKAANKAGMVTARMLHGKYTSVMPIEELEQPDFQISSIDEVLAVVRLADQQMIKPKIVAIGGGTGLAVLLKELRNYPADLTAIVTVFDSGRHSGALRKYLGILPPGDIRNCLVALSDSDELMNKLMNYRFKENFMEGCSLGNLLLAALTEIQGGFDKAITSIADILNIHGNVYPATLDNTELCAELADESVVVSEVNVRSPVLVDEDGNERKKPPIKRVFLENNNVSAFLPAVKAIESADIIVLSPGGFYTSIISPLLVPGIRDAIRRSAGATVYISNVATQCGQTDGYTLADTIDVLATYLGENAIDYVIANNAVPQSDVLAPYFARGEELLLPTPEMAEHSKPVLLQGKTFQETDMQKEWNKTPMIKHSLSIKNSKA